MFVKLCQVRTTNKAIVSFQIIRSNDILDSIKKKLLNKEYLQNCRMTGFESHVFLMYREEQRKCKTSKRTTDRGNTHNVQFCSDIFSGIYYNISYAL